MARRARPAAGARDAEVGPQVEEPAPLPAAAAAERERLEKRALAGQSAPDQQLLDLRGPLVQRRDTRVAQVLLHRELVDVAVAAVHLNGRVSGAHRDLAR